MYRNIIRHWLVGDLIVSLNAIVDQYESIRGVINSHAPLKTKKVTLRDGSPWMNPAVLDFRRRVRKAERIWRNGGYLEGHHTSYQALISEYSLLLRSVKAEFLCSTIADCRGDQRSLYRIVDSWMGRAKQRCLPGHKSAASLANIFSTFYHKKVEDIKAGLLSARASIDLNQAFESDYFLSKWTEEDLLTEFSPITVEEIYEAIMASPAKSCSLDPLPTKTLETVARLLAPSITSIINLSLQEGVFPDIYKHALVTPLLKKPNLDQEIVSNYRPVSNLPFVSKMLERIVSRQLDMHLSNFDLLSPTQSAYRSHHSTETALLTLQNYLLQAAGRGHGCIVLLLDLTAAFDTINHLLLLSRLSSHCGFAGTVLAWMASYLAKRTQSVIIGDSTSDPTELEDGVPQGSVLGPKFYSIYVNCLRKVAAAFGVSIQQFSDDTTVYLEFTFPPDCPDQLDALRILSMCTGDLIDWFTFNWVQLNSTKSDCLYCVPSELADKLPLIPLRVGKEIIHPSTSAKVLGVVLSSDLSMDRQIAAVARAANFNLYRLGKIRSHLTTEATKILVHSLVITHIDYANSLLAGLPKKKLKPLQSVQDSAARLIYRGTLSTEESRFRLHWLPVHHRILFKVLLLVFDCLQGYAPVLLQDCIQLHVPGHSGIRRRARSLGVVSSSRSRKKRKNSNPPKPAYLKRSFTSYAPHLWNKLPPPIRTTTDRIEFKKLLKTHFFALSYPSFLNH